MMKNMYVIRCWVLIPLLYIVISWVFFEIVCGDDVSTRYLSAAVYILYGLVILDLARIKSLSQDSKIWWGVLIVFFGLFAIPVYWVKLKKREIY